MKGRSKEREDLGVELYGVQQELARHQMMLENKHDHYSTEKQNRLTAEQELADTRSNYKKTQTNVNDQYQRGTIL